MRLLRKYYFFPLLLFLSLFIDGQFSFIFSRFIPNKFEAISFLFFYGFMMLSLYFSEICCIWLGIFFGFCFDVYFLNTLGISFLIFPLLQIIFYQWNQIILLNRLTRFLTFLLTIFCFQLLASFLEIFLIGIKFDLFSLVVFQIAPSLLLNLFLLLIFQPLFEKIYL